MQIPFRSRSHVTDISFQGHTNPASHKPGIANLRQTFVDLQNMDVDLQDMDLDLQTMDLDLQTNAFGFATTCYFQNPGLQNLGLRGPERNLIWQFI